MIIKNNMIPKTVEQKHPWIALDEIAPFLPKNPVIVEAGAHTGKDTLRLKKYWPESTIHTFEPIPELYEQLVEKTKDVSNVFCYQQALSDETGTSQMHISTGRTSACSSLLPPHSSLTQERPDIIFQNTISVHTTTLHAWAEKQNITHIDFLWLDLQGAELQALQGATQLLTTVKAIHSEINEAERYIGGTLYSELKNFLETHRFYVHIKGLYAYKWGNALFVRL